MLLIEASILTACVALLLGHDIWQAKSRRRHERRLAQARRHLLGLLMNPPLPGADLHQVRDLGWTLQVALFQEIAPSLGGAERAKIRVISDAIGLGARARVMCRSALWWRRLRGARLLTLLGGGTAIMPKLLEDTHSLVRAQAAEWAIGHPAPELGDALFRLLDDPAGLCRFAVEDALLRMGNHATDPLARYLATHSGPQVAVALKVAKGIATPRFLAPALHHSGSTLPVVRARSAGLLGALGGDLAIETLTTMHLADAEAQVRSAAAAAIGRLKHWPAAPALAKALDDPSWEVRRNAGLALRELGPSGVLFLRRASSSDTPAADIAKQALSLPGLATRALAA